MARANDGGWDFVKVGETYQYKEDSFIAMVKVIEDKSDSENYVFNLEVQESNYEPPQNGTFEISHDKNPGGYWSGMLQIYEQPEYLCNYKWNKIFNPTNQE